MTVKNKETQNSTTDTQFVYFKYPKYIRNILESDDVTFKYPEHIKALQHGNIIFKYPKYVENIKDIINSKDVDRNNNGEQPENVDVDASSGENQGASSGENQGASSSDIHIGVAFGNDKQITGDKYEPNMRVIDSEEPNKQQELIVLDSDTACIKADKLTLKDLNRMLHDSVNETQLRKEKERMLFFLEIFGSFIARMEKKYTRWTDNLEHFKKDMQEKINLLSNDIKTKQYQSDDELQKKEDQLVYYIRKSSRAYDTHCDLTEKEFKDFYVKSGRRSMRDLLNYMNQGNKFQEEDDIEKKHESKVHKLNKEMHKEISEKYRQAHDKLVSITNQFHGKLNEYKEIVNPTVVETLSDDKNMDMMKTMNITYDRIDTFVKPKIDSMIELKYSLLKMMIEPQLFVLYGLKVIRLLFIYVALFISTRMFIPIYENAVYDDKADPPPLWKFLLIFLGFDISLNIFLLVLMVLLKYLFKSDDNTFIIDGSLITKYCYDYVCSTSLILLVSALISFVIVEKKYFKYKYEGMRAIRAFEKIVFYISMVNLAMPFFLIF